MTLKLYPESDVQDIASAIRTKNSSSDTYTIGEMAQVIEEISSVGFVKMSDNSNLTDFLDGLNNMSSTMEVTE